MSNIRDFQVDHLLLLVGSNPLPNVVAGRRLVKETGKITLIYTEDALASDGPTLLDRLKEAFRRDKKKNIGINMVEESDADRVLQGVLEVLKEYRDQILKAQSSGFSDTGSEIRIGLNYTGGTKVMAVQAYRALEQWVNDPKRELIFSRTPVFSYLDARTLNMCIDPIDNKLARSFYVGQDVQISIRELLELHNWKTKEEPSDKPILPESAKVLLTVHSDPARAKEWREWLKQELLAKTRELVAPDSAFRVLDASGKEVQGYKVEVSGSDWNKKLKNQVLCWRNLLDVGGAISNELGLSDGGNLNLAAASKSAGMSEKAFCRWLHGNWLETAVFSVLQECAQDLGLNDCRMNIKPYIPNASTGEQGFEFDVAAVRGYQLFAFSCTTDDTKHLLKQKLFEAYVRARQMGGDEACTALVCCASKDKVGELEQEIRRDIVLKSRIKIFGREHLANLGKYIRGWISEQGPERAKRG